MGERNYGMLEVEFGKSGEIDGAVINEMSPGNWLHSGTITHPFSHSALCNFCS